MYRENGEHLIRLALRQSTFPTGEGLRRKRKPHGAAVYSHNTPVGVDVLGNPKKTNDYRNRNGGRPPPYDKENENLAVRRCVRTHPSLPPWGRCRTYVRRMRCSKFVPRKRRTPHPSCLTAIHLPHGGRLTKKRKPRGYAQNSPFSQNR